MFASTMKHVEQMLLKLLREIAEKHGYDDCNVQLKAISSGGANYISVLYAATVSSMNKKDLQLFAKVAAMNEETRATIPGSLFDIERYVYCELFEKFKRMEDTCGVAVEDRFVSCKFYGCNLNYCEETMVLENLAAQGFIVFDRMKSVDWPYASKAIESLAKFHALSMAYGEQYPEECINICKKFESILEPAYKAMKVANEQFVEMAIKETREENKDRLAVFLQDEGNYDLFHYSKTRRKEVLIHGDYRPNNLMHRVNKDGTVEIIPVDFQTIRPGCVVSDLLFFIFSGSDQQFRARHYDQLVELYYEQLCRSLRALHFDPEKVYSREDFDTELKEILPYGLVCGVLLLPVGTVDTEDAPDIHKEDLFQSLGKTKTSSVYPDRLNGIVDDYVKWGII